MPKLSKNAPEYELALGLYAVIEAQYGGRAEPWPANEIAGGCATLLSTILAKLPPADRTLIVSETVDAIFSALNDYHNADFEREEVLH